MAIDAANAVFTYWVDWTGTGLFNGSYDNVTALVIDAQWSLGRDYASQLTGRSIAGLASFTMKNSDGRFNSFNASSPLYGNILPGRLVKITAFFQGTLRTMWVGYLDKIEPKPDRGGAHTATLRSIGSLGRIQQRKVNVSMQTGILTGAAIGKILDEIGWASADRSIDTGQVTMNRWWTGGEVRALNAMRDVEGTEAGFIKETKDGKIAFEDQHHRITAPYTSSQATYTDSPSGDIRYYDIVQGDPLKEIYNIFQATVQLYTVGPLAVLWTLSETGTSSPSIDPGITRDFWANYPNPASTSVNGIAVDAWTTTVATTDMLANSAADGSGTNLTSGITIAVSKFDTAMKISLTNGSGTRAYITFLQARGTPVLQSDPVILKKEDTASKTKYGERTFPVPGKFLPSTTYADSYLGFLAGIYAEAAPIVTLTIIANLSQAQLVEALKRDISDRITIVANGRAGLGINRDFYVESMSHRLKARQHMVTMQCSDAQSFSGSWLLGISLLGIDTKLGL